MSALPLSGLIRPSSDGTFQRLSEPEPGAITAELLHVREMVFDPIEEVGDIYDCVAWNPQKPGVWWTERGLVTCVGEYELTASYWREQPARMLATPADYVAAHGAGFVILDWSADVNAIIGRVAAVECATSALYRKLRETLIEQAKPRGLTITVRAA
jgi:hypothetical protein